MMLESPIAQLLQMRWLEPVNGSALTAEIVDCAARLPLVIVSAGSPATLVMTHRLAVEQTNCISELAAHVHAERIKFVS